MSPETELYTSLHSLTNKNEGFSKILEKGHFRYKHCPPPPPHFFLFGIPPEQLNQP